MLNSRQTFLFTSGWSFPTKCKKLSCKARLYYTKRILLLLSLNHRTKLNRGCKVLVLISSSQMAVTVGVVRVEYGERKSPNERRHFETDVSCEEDGTQNDLLGL